MTGINADQGSAILPNINPNRTRFALAATTLCNGHPFSDSSSQHNHEYPHRKAYQSKSTTHIPNTAPFEELTGAILSYHHRFKDPMAFENRYKEVIDSRPNAFRKVKSADEITSSNRDMFGNEKVLSDDSIMHRMEGIDSRRSSRRSESSSSIEKTNTCRKIVPGWTRLSKSNIGIPTIQECNNTYPSHSNRKYRQLQDNLRQL